MVSLFLFTTGCLIPTAWAQSTKPVDYNNHFIWPPVPGPPANLDSTAFYENPVIEYGKPVSRPFTFLTQMSSTTIYMYQEQSPELAKYHLIQDCVAPSGGNQTTLHYWDGQIGYIDVTLTNVVFLIAYDCSDISVPIFFSHYFNLTRAASQTSTSIPASATLLIGTATSTATSTLVGTENTATASSTSGTGGESTSNNGATLAGGIGGGIGGAMLIIAVAFALWKYKSRNGEKSGIQRQSPAHGFQGPHSAAGSSSAGLRSMTTSPVYSNAYGHAMYHQPSNNGTSVWNHQAFQQSDAGAHHYKTDQSALPGLPVELAGDCRGSNRAIKR